MQRFNRRDILRMGAALAAGAGLSHDPDGAFAKGVEQLVSGQARVLWLQGLSCSGCSVSFLNAEHPGPVEILTDLISLEFHQNISAAQGEGAVELVDQIIDRPGYYLVFEGSLPMDMPEACLFGGKPLTERMPKALTNAAAIVAAGTCAAFGGIPSAEGNTTGSASLKAFMQSRGIPTNRRLVNCPGCPVHPESLVGTLAYIVGRGYPRVNPELMTPEAFFRQSVHDECPRFHDWEKLVFAEKFGDPGCLFELGCLGPHSHTNCPRRQWNGGINWCIRAGAPCIACTSEQFAKRRDFPFYRKGEKQHAVSYHEDERKGSQR